MDRREFFKFVGTRHNDYVPQNDNNKTEYDVPWGVCAAGALVFAGFVNFMKRRRPGSGVDARIGGHGQMSGDTVAGYDPKSIIDNPSKPAQTYERGNSAALQRDSDMKSYDKLIDNLTNKTDF